MVCRGWRLSCWSLLTYPDIYNYLNFNSNELYSSSDLNYYQNWKSFSYFNNRGWPDTILYHEIEKSSLHCFLKINFRPSERLNDPPHKLWACILKKQAKIMSVNCSCMAGMSGTCNHVAATLFGVEASVRLGLTNSACSTKRFECYLTVKIFNQLKWKVFLLSWWFWKTWQTIKAFS